MAGRRVPAGRPGGGALVQAESESRPRVAAGAGALALAGALAVYPVPLEADTAPLGLLGMLFVVAALARPAAALVAWGVASLGGAYALALVLSDRDLDPRAGLVAAGLFIVAELAFWSVEARDWTTEDSSAARARLAGMLILGLAGATVGTLLLAAGAAVPADLGLVQLAGALGAVGAVLALALLARR